MSFGKFPENQTTNTEGCWLQHDITGWAICCVHNHPLLWGKLLFSESWEVKFVMNQPLWCLLQHSLRFKQHPLQDPGILMDFSCFFCSLENPCVSLVRFCWPVSSPLRCRQPLFLLFRFTSSRYKVARGSLSFSVWFLHFCIIPIISLCGGKKTGKDKSRSETR